MTDLPQEKDTNVIQPQVTHIDGLPYIAGMPIFQIIDLVASDGVDKTLARHPRLTKACIDEAIAFTVRHDVVFRQKPVNLLH